MIDRTPFPWSLTEWVRITLAIGLSLGLIVRPKTSDASDSVVVVLLDDSGSMREQMRSDQGREPRMSVAKTALARVVKQLPEQTQFGLLLMNGARERGGWMIPLGSLNRSSALAQIENVRPDGGTPLGRSMKTAMDELLALRGKIPYGDYRLLVVTDGEATDRSVLEAYLPDMLARGVVVDVIGVDMKSEHSLATKAHSYRKANDAASFAKALNEIFAESNSAGSSDNALADFDLIAGLPDEFATESLKALTSASNNQIGEARPNAIAAAPSTIDSAASSPASSSGPVAAQPPVGSGEPGKGPGFGFIIGGIIFIIFVVSRLLKFNRSR